MNLYNGDIDEFVDWVDGKDSITEENRTNGLPVSGRNIRNLVQEHLREPIVFKEDPEAGLYRVFSSDAAYRRWDQDKENNADL
jgi:hypothetical protein